MLNQQPYIWYQFVDGSDSLGTQRYHVKRGVEPTAAQLDAATLRGVLGGLSGCTVREQRYVLPAVEVAYPNPIAGVQTERYGVFVFSCSEPGQFAIIAVPGLRDELLMTTGPGAGVAIDQTLPAIQTLVTELTSGSWVNRFGYVISTLEAAYLQVRDAVFVPDWLS